MDREIYLRLALPIAKVDKIYKIKDLHDRIVTPMIPAYNLAMEMYYALDLDDDEPEAYIGYNDEQMYIVVPYFGVITYEYVGKDSARCIKVGSFYER